MNRNALLDVSRAIAVMLVLTFHIWRDTGRPAFLLGDKFDLLGFMGNGWVGVGIFFVISGYCMGISTQREFAAAINLKGYCRYISKRFLRIAPPYYIAVAVWVYIIDTYGITTKNTTYFDILTHLTFVHNFFGSTLFSISGVFWTIAVEMQFYVLLPFLLYFIRKPFNAWLFFLLTLSLALLIFYFNFNPLYNWGLPLYLPLFIFGYILKINGAPIVNFMDRFKIAPCVTLILLALLLYKGEGYDNNVRPYEIFVSIIFGLIMVKMTSMNWDGAVVRILSFIGSASYSIYLYNYIYMSIKPAVNYNPVSSIVMWLSVIAVGITMYLLVETNTEKLRRFIFSKKAHKTITR
ncbi:acyltransferase family protein [Cronobacter malonaticus]|nr:acyltransferase [Cronobacter malonaticus]